MLDENRVDNKEDTERETLTASRSRPPEWSCCGEEGCRFAAKCWDADKPKNRTTQVEVKIADLPAFKAFVERVEAFAYEMGSRDPEAKESSGKLFDAARRLRERIAELIPE